MKVTFSDMRRNPGAILAAVSRNETVTLLRYGKPVARIVPLAPPIKPRAEEHPAFGIWKDRDDMAVPVEYVNNLRKRRFNLKD